MIEFVSLSAFETGYIFKSFDCGDANLNKYIRTHALINDKNNLSKTFVCVNDGVVIGYVTLCSAQVEFEKMPQSYKSSKPRYPVPAIRIARLAVDFKYQGKGYGKQLLAYTFKKIVMASEITGIKVIIVDVKEQSKLFYEKYGFEKLYELTYYLPIETIILAIKQ